MKPSESLECRAGLHSTPVLQGQTCTVTFPAAASLHIDQVWRMLHCLHPGRTAGCTYPASPRIARSISFPDTERILEVVITAADMKVSWLLVHVWVPLQLIQH